MTAIRSFFDVLLKRKVPIYCNEYVESAGRQIKQFAILYGGPTHLIGAADVVACKGT
jgi:hypothetical protein